MVLLQEWNSRDMKVAQKAIQKFLNSRHFEYSHGYTPNLYKDLGLAFTSSSSYAGLWVCNRELYLDKYHKFHIIGFAKGVSGFVYAICWDKDKNELIITIN
jgi:hypothetical protein